MTSAFDFYFPESIVKFSSVRNPLEKYIGSNTQSAGRVKRTEHSPQSEVRQREIDQSEVHRVKCMEWGA